MSDSILDKIIETNKQDSLTKVNPEVLLHDLFAVLNEREKEVLQKRFGLLGNDKHTLEKIGKGLDVTRERVRQIEISSIRKVKKHKEKSEGLKVLEEAVVSTLQDHEGVMAKHYVLDLLLEYAERNLENQKILEFVIGRILDDRIITKAKAKEFTPFWALADANLDDKKQLISDVLTILQEVQEPVDEDTIHSLYRERSETVREEVSQQLLRSLLHIGDETKQDIVGKWGIKNWSTVTPKRISDKIYIVLRHHNKPLHFTDIADKINELKFDRKVAYPATVHNELILNKKYVLIGRGIYALSEWGYEPGVVADVIQKIIEDNGPLTRDEIVDRVLQQRMVGKSTIHLALMNKERFKRQDDNKYVIIAT